MKKQLLRLMLSSIKSGKLAVIFILLLVTLQSSASPTVETQSAKISINLKGATLADILSEIEAKSGYHVFYNSDQSVALKNITINAKDKSVAEILTEILKNSGYVYSFQNNKTIVITQEVKAQPNKKIIVKGKVLNSDDRTPVVGATVLIKNTTVGAITDNNGLFTLTAVVGDIITVSYLGTKPYEKPLKENDTNLTINLDRDAVVIEEVIVTGYQEISKTRMTGSAETVTSKDITNKGYTSVEDILKGQMTGVATMSISGRPGAQAQIRVRGINSLTGDSNPIWIVDGMPLQGDVPDISMGGTEFQESVLTSGIGNISPDDIESITVLKDAAATAIYGSRAANGVIVIKTKRGSVGKSFINVQSAFSISEAPKNRLQLMNTEQKIDFERGIYTDFPGTVHGGRVHQILKKRDKGVYTTAQAEAEINSLRGIDTNWYDEVFRMAQSQTHSVTLSGGSETTQYYSNLSYSSQEGVMPNNKYENFGANIKLTHDFNKWFRVNFDVRTSLRSDRSSASVVNPLEYATFANPYERPYDNNGNYAYDRSYYSTLSTLADGYKYDFNIIEDLNNNTTRSRYNSNQANLKLEAKIIEGLMFSTMGTISTTNQHTMNELTPGSFSSEYNSWLGSFYNEKEIPNYMNNGKLSESAARSTGWTIRNQLEYARGFSNGNHYVNVLLGHEVSSNMGYGFDSMIPEWSDIYGTATYPDLIGSTITGNLKLSSLGGHKETQDRSVSMFMTASYSYFDRYVVAASGRLDGADIIGTQNRFAPLWNVSGKWNIHNEKFMSKVKFIDQFAFRFSYGFTGSIDRSALPFSVLRKTANYTYDGEKIRDRYDPSNPSIKWQRKEDLNFGLDLSMLNNRVNFTVNYYDNKTRNLIDTKNVAASTGRNQIKANVASLRNTGWELSLKTVNVRAKDFSWITSFNFSQNENIVTDTYYKDLKDYTLNSNSSFDESYNMYIQGQSATSFYGYKFAGVDPMTGGTLAYVDGFDEKGQRLGSLNGNGRYVFNIDEANNQYGTMLNAARGYLGESYPPITGGFSTQFNYKRFSLSASFTYMTGHKIRSFERAGTPVGISENNVLATEANRWRKPGDITTVPAYSTGRTEYLYQVFDFRFENGSFLKCNNISFGYNLPQNLCESIKLSSIRFNFNASNIFTLTKYRGIDPETMGAFTYPSARKYNFSISIGI